MRVWRYIIAFVLVTGLAVGMFLLRGLSHAERDMISCNKLEISFTDSLRFVTEANIRRYLDTRYGNYIGQRLDSVKLRKIEDLIESRSSISDCQAWMTDEGVLHICVSQRAPVLRFDYGDGGYYIDKDGYIFPLHDSYTAPVPVVEGNTMIGLKASYKGYAPDPESRLWISRLLALNTYISRSKNWRKRVDRMVIADNGDLWIQLYEGKEKFVFGQVTDIEQKFGGIEKYYNYIAPTKEGNYYKTVILKYKKQIICNQKDI